MKILSYLLLTMVIISNNFDCMAKVPIPVIDSLRWGERTKDKTTGDVTVNLLQKPGRQGKSGEVWYVDYQYLGHKYSLKSCVCTTAGGCGQDEGCWADDGQPWAAYCDYGPGPNAKQFLLETLKMAYPTGKDMATISEADTSFIPLTQNAYDYRFYGTPKKDGSFEQDDWVPEYDLMSGMGGVFDHTFATIPESVTQDRKVKFVFPEAKVKVEIFKQNADGSETSSGPYLKSLGLHRVHIKFDKTPDAKKAQEGSFLLNVCADQGATCKSGEISCCDGRTCQKNSDGDFECCFNDGKPCSGNDECCSTQCVRNPEGGRRDKYCCKRQNNNCDENWECCSGNCKNNKCTKKEQSS